MDHIKRVTDEFARQAQTFDASAEKTDAGVADDESNLQNAIERLRDPSHVRMLSASELHSGVARAGFRELEYTIWDKSREFEECMWIVNDAARAESVRTVVRALAEAGRTAGMGLCIKDAQVVFFHRWRLVKAVKPLGH